MTWTKTTLSEVSDIQTGPFGSQLHASDYVNSGIPTIMPQDIVGNRVITDTIACIREEDAIRLAKYRVAPGDIIYSRRGDVERHALIGNAENMWLCGTGCLRVRPNKHKVIPQYLHYYLSSPDSRAWIRSHAHGTTMPNLNTTILGETPICYPQIENQIKICGILELLDKKIDINNDLNDHLYEVLQTVYQQRFPSFDQGTMLGALSDICNYSTDRIAVSCLTVSNYYSTENMLPGKAGAVVASNLPSAVQTTKCKVGDVLISNIRPYFKKIIYCQSNCGCSTDVLCFSPNTSKLSAYLFSTLYADHFFDFMVAGAKGTKMPRGDKQQIMTYPVYIPSETELDGFNEIAQPILSQIERNRLENRSLSNLRDGLLPKLMSGDLDVSSIPL